MELGDTPPVTNPATIPRNGAPEVFNVDARQLRAQIRLEIATSLLQGKIVLRERDGYDPGGFRRQEVTRTCGGALDMADELMRLNDKFDKGDTDGTEDI